MGLGERRKPDQSGIILLRSFAAKKWYMSWQYQWDIGKDFVWLVTIGRNGVFIS